ncbi:SPOR domain-containing protein [Rhodopseudomonas palustris]|uniref:SPOR domain-containing protein n=1 Tax=Rhodopseudomonas palustris TaxID=1076 RepID=UPI002ACE9ABF|nr:SPOR domain-containing protein [Rhodopseudomonas palustris]WQH00724.1 SPOR domain-containing protein [Rhodopseudomonas palustris]
MARNSDDLADSFATDESGGWLARFVADEEDLDTRAKWKLASWAAGSLGALVIAILATQTATERKRDQVAAADLVRQSQQIQRLAKESQSEASRLAAAIDTLNSDRDRLYSRLGSLEQGLESVTGSIARVQASAKPAAGHDKAAATALPEIPIKEPPALQIAAVDSKSSAPATPSVPPSAAVVQPAPSPPKRAVAATAAEPVSPSPKVDQPEPPLQTPVAATPASAVRSPSAVPASTPAQEADTKRIDRIALAAVSPATPLIASRSMLAPPDSAAGKLLEPRPSAARGGPEDEPEADSADETPVVVPRTEFGAELGGANSLEGLRSLWRRMSKAHKELKDMQPIVMVKENASGGQLRLVVGPFNDAAAAAGLCAKIGAADRGCETSVFDGQRLPLISTAPPPRMPRKRPPKVTAAPEPPPPPEPQPAPKPASLSGFLGIR